MALLSASFFKRVAKFGLASGVATAVDFLLFRFVFLSIMDLYYAELLASFIGMIINFFLQKKFVFKLQRKAVIAFILSISTSIVVMFIGAELIFHLAKIEYLATHISIAKIIVIGFKFGMNFFIKQWVFEKKFIHKKEDETEG